jgi:hypothetical protein
VKRNFYLSFVIIQLFSNVIGAATGDIIKRFACPGSCPTALCYDGIYLWLADRKTDSLYRINPENGEVVGSYEAPGYQIEGLTWEKYSIWALDIEEKAILRFNPASGVNEKIIYAPCDDPQGLAYDGNYLWIGDMTKDRIYQISTDDGTTIREIKSPSGNPTGLAYDGRYLWVADRLDDMIYMVVPENGNVAMSIPSPSKYPRGVAYDGTSLWNVDYQSDSLYQIKLDDTALFVRSDPKRQRLVYTHQFRNYGPGTVVDLDIYLAIPKDLPNQKLVDSPTFIPPPAEIIADRWGQRVAHYHYDGLLSGGSISVSMSVSAELYKTRYFINPERAGNLSDIPKEISRTYLADDAKYWVYDSLIQRTAKEVIDGETNCYWIGRKIFNYLIDKMHYELTGGWNVAPTVLARGSGSCSEYSFVYIALCRAAGLPARYAGAVTVRGDDASTDDVFHRWVEIYLPHYGWIPVDPSGGDQDSPSRQASYIGLIDNRYLITTIGGGGSEYLEWSYNSNEIWKSKGKCKVYAEHIGEWSPLDKNGEESSLSGDEGKGCKIK